MNNLGSRIGKLEKHTGAGKPERKTWVIVKGEPRPVGVKDGDTVIIVSSEKAKELTEGIKEFPLWEDREKDNRT